MLTLDPASACEVCAEAFGPGHVPAVIPCGHVFCAQCLATIVDKTSPRLTPACPLCRGTFTDKTWRLIRVDLGGSCSGSGWSGAEDDGAQDEGAARVSQIARADAKRLEDKVAQAASKKCSFEEVSALHKEVQDWLSNDTHKKADPQHASLRLSADLLRAILLNCLAYSESNKVAKTKEAALQTEIEKLNAEVRRQRDIIAIKTQEAEKLRDELHKLRPSTPTSSTPIRQAAPATRPIPSTPQRPGTSLGFSSSSSRGHSTGSSQSPSALPAIRGASGHASAAASLSRPSTPSRRAAPVESPSNIPPVPPLPPIPPAPQIPYAALAPSPSPAGISLASRATTPAPFVHHRRASSIAVPPRPSTAMGSHSRHERWIPSATADNSPPSRGIRYTSLGSRGTSMARTAAGGFPVLEEAD